MKFLIEQTKGETSVYSYQMKKEKCQINNIL